MNIQGFYDELKNDPLNRGYAQMDDAQLWVSLTTQDRLRDILINSRQLLEWAAQEGRLANIEDNANNEQNSASLRAICKAASKLVERADTMLDLTHQHHIDLVDALVNASVLSVNDRTSLQALGKEACSRAEELNCEDMSFPYMVYLRSLPN